MSDYERGLKEIRDEIDRREFSREMKNRVENEMRAILGDDYHQLGVSRPTNL